VGAFAAPGGQHAGVAGVGITPAQVLLQPAGHLGQQVNPVVRQRAELGQRAA
jgi:hypothetical protein